MESLTLKIEGMSCNHCKMAVEKALKTLPGVQSAQVNLEANTAEVVFDPQQVSVTQLKSAVTDAGYEVVD